MPFLVSFWASCRAPVNAIPCCCASALFSQSRRSTFPSALPPLLRTSRLSSELYARWITMAPFFHLTVTHRPRYASASFWEASSVLATVWGLQSTKACTEESAKTPVRILLIDLIWFLKTYTVVFMDESTRLRLIAWFTVFLSPPKPQVKTDSPSMHNFAKYGLEYWLLNPLWLLKGWLYPPGCGQVMLW